MIQKYYDGEAETLGGGDKKEFCKELLQSQWISIDSGILPPAKEGWNHSERLLLFYANEDPNKSFAGVGYYHYQPPFSGPRFVDFEHYGRQPTHWSYMPVNLVKSEPKVMSGIEKVFDTLKALVYAYERAAYHIPDKNKMKSLCFKMPSYLSACKLSNMDPEEYITSTINQNEKI